jgi:hypothetical protein
VCVCVFGSWKESNRTLVLGLFFFLHKGSCSLGRTSAGM